MIKVTFEFDTAASAAAFLQDFDSPMNEQTGAPSAGTPAKRGRPRKEASAADPTSAATPATVVTSTPTAPVAQTTPSSANTATAVPFSALVEPLTALADKDLDAAVRILATYGAKTARDLKPEQFGPVLAEVTAALTPTPAARPSLI